MYQIALHINAFNKEETKLKY